MVIAMEFEKIRNCVDEYFTKEIKESEDKSWYRKQYRKVKKFIELLEKTEPLKKGEEVVIKVDWKKNRTWGYTCRAKDNYGNDSGVVSGTGYDKLSTAVALVLNKNPKIMKRIYEIKEQNFDEKIEDVLGYGISEAYGCVPYFDGGVGINSLINVLENAGFNVKHYSTEMADIVIISL